MDKIILLLILFSFPVIFIYFRKQRKLKRRAVLLETEFPKAWEAILEERMPLYRRMPVELREQLRRHIKIFLSEKSFEGCKGQKIDDKVRVVIAAYACMLLLNRETDYYPDLTSILVYPDAYWVNDEFHVGGGQTIKSKAVNLGESWENGVVVLSWKQIEDELSDEKCGQSLVIHEFAHQIDAEDGFLNGLPELGEGSSYGQWAKVFAREYEGLKEGGGDGDGIIDDYGSRDPAEFFSVVTEGFFLMAPEMKARHPELYSELMKFYKVDPSQWNWSY